MVVFAYGSNMSYNRILNRIPSAKFLDIGILRKHSLKIHKKSADGSAKADAFFTGNNEDLIYGVIYEINTNDKKALDDFEGLGNGYDEKTEEIELNNGKVIIAQLYYANKSAIDSTLLPFSWYLNFIIEGAIEHNLPEDYISKLKIIKCLEDKSSNKVESITSPNKKTKSMTLLDKLKNLGFTKKDDNELISSTDYKIEIEYNAEDESKSKINYGKKIINSHKGSILLKKPENLVVLECVIRLLNKGYKPECIELEKTWSSGHGTSGRLDIYIKDLKGKSYAMIECKTWGEEYSKERNNILEDGGQLFTYHNFESTTKQLIIYASVVEDGSIKIQSEAIDASELNGTNSDERYKSWDKSFIQLGIFEDEAKPYNSKRFNLTKDKLQELDKDTGKGLFNSFAEILRRHTVSDKSNAFNKIFNLFVCKIYDEDTKRTGEELDFQWKINDTKEQFFKRLEVLYSKGLLDYLQIDIDLKFFSILNELSFTDVFDDDSYNENFLIVKEVVELLQVFQIKYTSKHQYLGDFFENLLSTGIKQEAGQYFTPIPLARFFLKSIPVKQIIDENIKSKKLEILPYIIDYSCGSGHFLTEAIEEINDEVEKINVSTLVGRIQKHFLAMKDNFFWAKEFVYGIEKDYRLAKTTKIAMFLNGDGDAQIINGDGLDDFYESKSYKGILKTNSATRNNNKFDILVSNPPFSIPGFKQYLKNGKQNFSLFDFLSPKSSEIECLFIERLSQMLKDDGCAGIILPLSILNSDNRIYVESRKQLLFNFQIVSIVELRDKTFIATNTTTVGLFLKKRRSSDILQVLERLSDFANGKADKELESQIKLLSEKFDWFKLTKSDLKSHYNENPLEKIVNVTTNYTSYSNEIAFLIIWLLNLDFNTVISYSGEKKEQEEYLGYRFSKSRGSEGCEPILNDQGDLESKLYDPNDILNINKVNSHIRSNYLNVKLEVPGDLSNNLTYIDSTEIFEKNNFVIKNPSSYFTSENYAIESNSQLGDFIDEFKCSFKTLADLLNKGEVSYLSGLVYNKKSEVPNKTNKRVLTASNLDLKTGKLVYDKLIYLKEDYDLPKNIIPVKNDIIISNSSGSLKHLGKVAIVEEDLSNSAIGGFLSIIRFKDSKLAKAFYYRFLSHSFRKYAASLRDQNINNLNFNELKGYKFSIPNDLDAFVKEANNRERQLKEIEEKLKTLKK